MDTYDDIKVQIITCCSSKSL